MGESDSPLLSFAQQMSVHPPCSAITTTIIPETTATLDSILEADVRKPAFQIAASVRRNSLKPRVIETGCQRRQVKVLGPIVPCQLLSQGFLSKGQRTLRVLSQLAAR